MHSYCKRSTRKSVRDNGTAIKNIQNWPMFVYVFLCHSVTFCLGLFIIYVHTVIIIYLLQYHIVNSSIAFDFGLFVQQENMTKCGEKYDVDPNSEAFNRYTCKGLCITDQDSTIVSSNLAMPIHAYIICNENKQRFIFCSLPHAQRIALDLQMQTFLSSLKSWP